MENAFGIFLGENPGVSCIRKRSIPKCILLFTVFYRLRIRSVEKFLQYQPRLTATAGFFGGLLCEKSFEEAEPAP